MAIYRILNISFQFFPSFRLSKNRFTQGAGIISAFSRLGNFKD